MTFAVIKSFEEIKRCQDGKLLTTDQTHGWGSRSGSPRTVWRWIHTHTPGKGWWETADSAIQPAEITRFFLHLHPRSWSGWSRAESRRYRLSICGEAPSYSVRMTVCLLPIIHKSVRWIGSTGGSSHIIIAFIPQTSSSDRLRLENKTRVQLVVSNSRTNHLKRFIVMIQLNRLASVYSKFEPPKPLLLHVPDQDCKAIVNSLMFLSLYINS